MFENNKTSNGIHYSRYIASWKKVGGRIYRGGLFERWLREVEHLNDHEVSDILNLAECGKLELETSAKKFIEQNKKDQFIEKEVSLKAYGRECGMHFSRLRKIYDEERRKLEEDKRKVKALFGGG